MTTPTPRTPRPRGRPWLFLIVVVLLGLGADLGSKYLAFATIADAPVSIDREAVLARPNWAGAQPLIPPHEPVVVIPYVLEFKLVLNTGAVFGLGAGQRWIFVGFTLLVTAVAVGIYARWGLTMATTTRLALGLLMAGGLGNVYDRIVYASVRDFIHPLPGVMFPFGWRPLGGSGEIWPYVSNVADLILIIGIGLLLFGPGGRHKAEPAPPTEEDAQRSG